MPLPLLLLAACAPEPPAGGSAPTVYLATPADASTWRSVAPVPVAGMVVDDGDAPPTLTVEVWADDELRLRLAPGERGSLAAELALPVGEHRIAVVATDPEGLAGRADVTVEVVEEWVLAAPTFTLTPDAPVTGDTVRAELAATDPSLTYVWAWTLDGAPWDTTAPVIAGEDVQDGQAWGVTVYATDGVEFSPTTSAALTVGNAPPELGSLRISPAGADVSDALTCVHAPPTDPDDPDLTVVTRWWLDGVAADVTGDTLPAGLAPRGTVVTCGLEATEASGRITTATSAPLTLANALPVVAGATLSPASFTETDVVTCVPGEVTDADGDPVTLTTRWTVDGHEIAGGDTLDGASFSRGDEVGCEVWGNDGYADGPAVASELVAVGNSPPSAPVVAFTSTVIVPGKPASCAVIGASLDPDGDRVRYVWSWTVDGAPSPEATATLATDTLSPGAVLTCTATPTDGELLGPAAAASLALATPTTGDVALADSPVVLAASGAATSFGAALVSPGDLDGDGLADLLVGEPLADLDAGADAGRVWIVTAGTGPLPEASASWLDGDAGSRLGARSTAADLDGDGALDLVVGAPGDARGGTDAGTVGIWLGSSPLPSGTLADADALLLGAPGDTLGGALLVVPDRDGDGLPELVLGAPGADLLAVDGGAGMLLPGGGATGGLASDLATLLVAGDTAGEAWGGTLADAGDTDGDGVGELLLGAPLAGGGAGAACLVSGSALGTLAPGDTSGCVTGAAGAALGASLGALDFDGDPLPDLLVGAPGAASLLVLPGRSGWPASPALTLHGSADRAGAAVTVGLPADADGYGTLAVGAPDADGGGAVYVLSGP